MEYKKYKRVFVIVMDSLGMGAMPDAEKFGDIGVDTLGHISEKMDTFTIPNLQKLGMANLKKLNKTGSGGFKPYGIFYAGERRE